ncbi:MAG: YeeE/YedE thiosulfate transporter family protein [Bacteroidota bacterium]
MIDVIKKPWPWYVAGPLIGLTVPALLIFGNRSFGISSTFRDICAACLPAKLPFFSYNWRTSAWNLYFVLGIFLGAVFAGSALANPAPVIVDPRLSAELAGYGITDFSALLPVQLFNLHALLTFRGFIFTVIGGFLVGFGTRYAGGCTSGHAIMGISALQWPSVLATCCFMAGGFATANLVLPYLLAL